MKKQFLKDEQYIEKLQNNTLTCNWLKLGIMSLGLAGVYSVILVILRTSQLSHFFPNPEIFKSALIIHVNLSVLVWLLSITASIWSYGMSFPQKRESRKNILDSRFCGNDNRVLSKLAYREEFEGDTEHRTAAYSSVREDSSTGSTYKLPLEVEFRKNSIVVLYLNIYPKLAFLGTILIAISPTAGQNPVMNNYIPMLENIIFVLGLTLFGIAILLFALSTLYLSDWQNWQSLMNFAILSTAIMFILTWVCFTCSYLQLQRIIDVIPIEIDFYYELLFWSGGHLLQFIYTQILMTIWIILFEVWLGKKLQFQKFYLFLLCLNFIFSLFIIAGHFFYDIIDGEFKEYYMSHMKYFGEFAPVSVLFVMVYEMFIIKCSKIKSVIARRCDSIDVAIQEKINVHSAINYYFSRLPRRLWRLAMTVFGNSLPTQIISSCAKATIICSSILFLFGGLTAFRIAGINIVIPAHYHGSIVGISIACMGFTYLLISPKKTLLRKYSKHLKDNHVI